MKNILEKNWLEEIKNELEKTEDFKVEVIGYLEENKKFSYGLSEGESILNINYKGKDFEFYIFNETVIYDNSYIVYKNNTEYNNGLPFKIEIANDEDWLGLLDDNNFTFESKAMYVLENNTTKETEVIGCSFDANEIKEAIKNLL